MASPSDNEDYEKLSYWEKRYEEEKTFDWGCDVEKCLQQLVDILPQESKILVLGCGNSEMSCKLYLMGYKNIVNVDYSETVIEKMAQNYAHLNGMTWQTMDMYSLDFSAKSFDCVLEKCTFEVLFCKEKSPWSTSPETVENFSNVLHQVEKVLCPGGQLISISFTQPHFRLPLLRQCLPSWTFDHKTFGDMFHYFLYISSKPES